MRHYNSPEEIAKREGAAATPNRPEGFRHYNSPEEVAKRERAGRASSPIAPTAPARRVVDVKPEPWPPAGQDNTAMVRVDAAAPLPTRPRSPASLDLKERLEQLEAFVYALLDDPREAREFRLQLNNQAATTDAVRDLTPRVRALEGTVEQLVAHANAETVVDDDDDDDEPADGLGPARAGDTQPPPPPAVDAPADAPAAPVAPVTPSTSEPTT